jgi:predicted DNA-binding transcriptional regulator AlpA
MNPRLVGSVIVEVPYSLGDDLLVKAAEFAHNESGANVIASSEGSLVEWDFGFDENEFTGSPVELASMALEVVDVALREVGVTEWTLARVAAISDEEQRREARRTSPVVGMSEATDLLGVSRQRVYQLMETNKEFPEPYGKLRSGPVWLRDDLLRFAGTRRGPGRPRGGMAAGSTQQDEDERPMEMRA